MASRLKAGTLFNVYWIVVCLSFLLSVAGLFTSASARAELCDASKKFCGYWPGDDSQSTGAPTRGSKIKINPAAVPVEKATGIETIFFDGVDVALVRGMGRVGAGISPSASEGTFFGPPGIELPEDYLERRIDGKKYPSQKITLATAFRVFTNKRSGMRQFEANLGVLGKYNQLTQKVTGGAGVSGKAAFFTYGYSLYSDQTRLDFVEYGRDEKPVTKFWVETASIGVFLQSVALDYSLLRVVTNDVSIVNVFTASLLLRRVILTLATRKESSPRPRYNSSLKTLETSRDKRDLFLGAQFNLGKHLLAGVFHNYYTMGELSLGATFFF